MSTAAAVTIIALTGFTLNWSSTPASEDSTGSAVVTVTIEEGDLLAVNTEDGSRVNYEITATIDGSGFLRIGGRQVDGSFPISEVLEYGSLQQGGHMVAVTLTDLESGSVRRAREEVFVDSFDSGLWTSGAIRREPDGPVRASGYISISWNVYRPDGSGVPSAAFALLDGNTEVVREGWFQVEETGDGSVSCSTRVVLNGLPKGRYRITAAALIEGEVVSSATSSVTILESWDVWGDDPEVTTTLIRPIASSHELRELERAGGLGDRNSVMADFWNRRDPNPATRGNEFLQEYLSRLDYVTREFSTTGTQGINTDRGIVYAKLGEPDIIQNFPFELGMYPYITWEYFSPSLSVTFVDQSGYGFYELAESWETVNRAFNAGEDWAEQ